MFRGETPKKLCVAKRPTHESPKDYCRYCKLSLKLQNVDELSFHFPEPSQPNQRLAEIWQHATGRP